MKKIKIRNERTVDGVRHKFCSKCKTYLPCEMFGLKKTRTNTIIYKSACNPCNTKHSKAYRDSMKQKAVEYLGGHCVDCKHTYPLCAYDFHHLDPAQKDQIISKMLRTKVTTTWDEMTEELDKCVLLCSNCHRIRHSVEGGLISQTPQLTIEDLPQD